MMLGPCLPILGRLDPLKRHRQSDVFGAPNSPKSVLVLDCRSSGMICVLAWSLAVNGGTATCTGFCRGQTGP